MQGSRVLVIGGTHGMGLATVRALRARGAQVWVTGRNPVNVERARLALADEGTGVIVQASDVGQLEALDALAADVARRFGQLDALLVFAGIAELAPFDQVTPESFDRQFAVNTRGVFFALQRLSALVRDGGSITTTTVTPATATPGMGVYLASKAAVRSFSQVLAAELLARGVRVNCLAPGFIDTPSLGVTGLSEAERAALSAIGDQATPMRRHGHVDEIARAALFLAFEATFSTGIELAVDGGISTVDVPVDAPVDGRVDVPVHVPVDASLAGQNAHG